MKSLALLLLPAMALALAGGCNKTATDSQANDDSPSAGRSDGREPRSTYRDEDRWFQKSRQATARPADESRTAWRKSARRTEQAIEQAEDRADEEADRPRDIDRSKLRRISVDDESTESSNDAADEPGHEHDDR